MSDFGTTNVSLSITMETTTCSTCHIPFAIPDWLLEARRKDGKTLYCPSGHTLHYPHAPLAKSQQALATSQREAERLRAELKKLRVMIEDIEEGGTGDGERRKAGQKLSEDERQAIWRLVMDGKSAADIVKATGVSQATAIYYRRCWLDNINGYRTRYAEQAA